MNSFLVTLYKSDNDLLKYPVMGRISILETGTDGSVIRAIFQMNYGGPVEVNHPSFSYSANGNAAEARAAALEQERDEYGRMYSANFQAAQQREAELTAERDMMAEAVRHATHNTQRLTEMMQERDEARRQLAEAQARIAQLERETKYFQSTDFAADRDMSEWEAETPLGQTLDGQGDEVEP